MRTGSGTHWDSSCRAEMVFVCSLASISGKRKTPHWQGTGKTLDGDEKVSPEHI